MSNLRQVLRIGAVIEIPTAKGLAYAQYTHNNDLMGALIRVLPGLHASRPQDFGALAEQHELYVTFFPLEAALRERMIALVGQEPVPARARKLPVFRAAGVRNPRTGRPSSWWLWDGSREWRADSLTEEQKRFPLREAVMPPVLIERLEQGWTPEAALADSTPTQAEAGSTQDAGGTGYVRHYLYFSTHELALQAATVIRRNGIAVELRPSNSTPAWLVLARSDGSSSIESIRHELEKTAARFGGQYDEWEAELGV